MRVDAQLLFKARGSSELQTARETGAGNWFRPHDFCDQLPSQTPGLGCTARPTAPQPEFLGVDSIQFWDAGGEKGMCAVRVPLFDYPKIDLNQEVSIWGESTTLGLSLPWGSPKVEPCVCCCILVRHSDRTAFGPELGEARIELLSYLNRSNINSVVKRVCTPTFNIVPLPYRKPEADTKPRPAERPTSNQ